MLLRLETSLKHCGRIASDAPQAFYKCLLAGIKVPPDQTAKYYQAALKGASPEFLALPLPDEPAADDSDDGIIVGGTSSVGGTGKGKMGKVLTCHHLKRKLSCLYLALPRL